MELQLSKILMRAIIIVHAGRRFATPALNQINFIKWFNECMALARDLVSLCHKPVFPNLFLANPLFSAKQISIAPLLS